MVDRDYEFAVANQVRSHLTSDLRTDDPLPTAGDTTEHEGVFQAALPQQPINSCTDRQRRCRPGLRVAKNRLASSPRARDQAPPSDGSLVEPTVDQAHDELGCRPWR